MARFCLKEIPGASKSRRTKARREFAGLPTEVITIKVSGFKLLKLRRGQIIIKMNSLVSKKDRLGGELSKKEQAQLDALKREVEKRKLGQRREHEYRVAFPNGRQIYLPASEIDAMIEFFRAKEKERTLSAKEKICFSALVSAKKNK
ncbi:MAG: hypothetical protein ABIE23_06635 [archaeon]